MLDGFFEQIYGDSVCQDRKLSIFTLPNHRSARFASIDDACKYVLSLPVKYDVYHCMSLIGGEPTGRGGTDDTAAIGCVWADVDISAGTHKNNLPSSISEAIDFLRQHQLQPTLVVNSGYGLHAYWCFDKPWLFDDEQDRQRAGRLTKGWHQAVCDAAANRGWKLENLGDLPRILRTPGTRNNKLADNRPLVEVIYNSGEVYKPEDLEKRLVKTKPKAHQANGSSRSAYDRCLMYLDHVPGAIQGQSGGTQTLIACRVIFRFGLDGEAARKAFDYYNQRCEPPWTNEKQIEHKLSDARKIVERDGEFGKWAEKGNPFDDVDLSRFLNTPDSQRPVDAPKSVALFPDDCLHPPGLLSEIIDWNLRTALWPQPELALAGALALLGVITGRKVQDKHRTRTNIYCLGLAASGAGKEYARTVNKEILLRAGADKMLGPEGLASSAGMIQFVNTNPSILFQLDEIGRMLETMRDPKRSPHLYKIGTELMKLDSCSSTLYKGDAYANQKQSVVINQPHCCIYGTSVPRGFWESLTEDNVSEGLLGRMFVFESSRRYVDIAEPEIVDLPESIISGVCWWLERPFGSGELSDVNPKPEIVPHSAEAKKRMSDHMAGICKQRATEDDTRAALWSRTTGKTAKLALLLACSRCTGSDRLSIEIEDVELSIKISNWLTRRMIWQAYRHVSHNDREHSVKRVLRILDSKISRSELTRKTQWLDRRKREEILLELVDSGLVRTWQEQVGKTSVTWFEASN